MAEGKGRVCVTGGTGFLGSWIIKSLLENGYSVNTTIRADPGKSPRIFYLFNLIILSVFGLWNMGRIKNCLIGQSFTLYYVCLTELTCISVDLCSSYSCLCTLMKSPNINYVLC
jgi:hypothetical protein